MIIIHKWFCEWYTTEELYMNGNNTVTFTTDDNEEVEFRVLEHTQLNGISYILVTDADEDAEEGNAYILKEKTSEKDEAFVYEIVEDEEEMELIGKIFSELLEDINLE